MIFSNKKSLLRKRGALSTYVLVACFVAQLKSITMTIIDTKTPIVIRESVKKPFDKTASEDRRSYFGYSLAFMEGDSMDSRSSSERMLYIAAPNDKRLTKNSGVVWKCKFQDNQNLPQLSCSVLSAISNYTNRESRCEDIVNSLHFPEDTAQQWIGASLSVSTSSNELFTCAPKWKMNGWTGPGNPVCSKETALVGECYMISPEGTVKLLDPLGLFNGKGNKSFAREFNTDLILFTQFGISSHFTHSEDFLVGAPSANWGKGLIAQYKMGVFQMPSKMLNEDTNTNLSDYNSLLGYTLASGKTQNNINYLASGAPRGANLYGTVVILNLANSKVMNTYKGEHFGSYFGYSLATVDLNGDGNDKLLVGAPMYSLSDVRLSTGHNIGCVFIYDVSPSSKAQPLKIKLCMDSRKSTGKISVSAGARFGSAICNLGDINFDGNQDFAVSAPYNDNGRGTVFIYYGGDKISENPDQVIHGKSLEIPNLQSFGTYLLSGKRTDIDGNGTPDLIVSSLNSRHVIILRTRPVAHARIDISFHTAQSEGLNGSISVISPDQDRFRVRVCIALTFNIDLPLDKNLDFIGARLTLEVGENEKRVEFGNRKNRVEMNYNISIKDENCLFETLKLTIENEYENFDPVKLQAIVKYDETEQSTNDTVYSATMVLTNAESNHQNDQYQQSYQRFKEFLPAPIYQTATKNLDIVKDNCNTDLNATCDPELHMKPEVSYKRVDGKEHENFTQDKTLIVGEVDSVYLSILVSNKKETAYKPTVRITFVLSKNFEMNHDLLQLEWQTTPGRPQDCNSSQVSQIITENSVNIFLTLECSRPLHKGRDNKYLFKIGNLKHLKMKEEESKGLLRIWVDVFPRDQENQEIKTEFIAVPLKGDVQIDVETSIPSSGQSKIDPMKTSLLDVSQLLIVKNLGFTATATNRSRLVVEIPTHLKMKGGNTSEVIRIADPSSKDIRCVPINFSFFKPVSTTSEKNLKTSTAKKTISTANKTTTPSPVQFQEAKSGEFEIPLSSDKFITIKGCGPDGKLPKEACKRIECFMNLPSKGTVQVTLQMYLPRETVAKLVSEETKGIRIESIISVFYFDKKEKEKVGSAQREFFLSEESIPAWIYLASGAGGTILFLLVAFTLFKCGFFERKVKKELKVLKRKTMQMNQVDLSTLMVFNPGMGEVEDFDYD